MVRQYAGAELWHDGQNENNFVSSHYSGYIKRRKVQCWVVVDRLAWFSDVHAFISIILATYHNKKYTLLKLFCCMYVQSNLSFSHFGLNFIEVLRRTVCFLFVLFNSMLYVGVFCVARWSANNNRRRFVFLGNWCGHGVSAGEKQAVLLFVNGERSNHFDWNLSKSL